MKVSIIKNKADQQVAFAIREQVFVREQNVEKSDEYDDFEKTSTHYLAKKINGEAIGTARWRTTKEGIKLERFAVLKSERGKGVGSVLLSKILDDIEKNVGKGKHLYLHAQESAMPLYKKYGFVKKGDIFDECGILHYKMTKKT